MVKIGDKGIFNYQGKTVRVIIEQVSSDGGIVQAITLDRKYKGMHLVGNVSEFRKIDTKLDEVTKWLK